LRGAAGSASQFRPLDRDCAMMQVTIYLLVHLVYDPNGVMTLEPLGRYRNWHDCALAWQVAAIRDRAHSEDYTCERVRGD
jgi:hypothetical protein